MNARSQRLRIVVAGGGVAGVELVLALHHLAAELVHVTIVSPDPSFQCKALRTAQPFSADHLRRHVLCELADAVGAELVIDSVTAVDTDRHAVLLSRGTWRTTTAWCSPPADATGKRSRVP